MTTSQRQALMAEARKLEGMVDDFRRMGDEASADKCIAKATKIYTQIAASRRHLGLGSL